MSQEKQLTQTLGEIETAADRYGVRAAESTLHQAHLDTELAKAARADAVRKFQDAQLATRTLAAVGPKSSSVDLEARVALAAARQAVDDTTAALEESEKVEMAAAVVLETAKTTYQAAVVRLARTAMRLACDLADPAFQSAVEANRRILTVQSCLNDHLSGYQSRSCAVPDGHWTTLSSDRLEGWREFRRNNLAG